jgi:hypothetical protein
MKLTNFSFQVVDNFDDMNLKEELLRGIYAYGFEKPSAIQQRAIIPCVKGHDVIAQAQSGMFSCLLFFPSMKVFHFESFYTLCLSLCKNIYYIHESHALTRNSFDCVILKCSVTVGVSHCCV